MNEPKCIKKRGKYHDRKITRNKRYSDTWQLTPKGGSVADV